MKYLIWLVIILGGTFLAFVAQDLSIHHGMNEIDAMGIRGFINGATVSIAASYFTRQTHG